MEFFYRFRFPKIDYRITEPSHDNFPVFILFYWLC